MQNNLSSYSQLHEKIKKVADLGFAESVLNWDQQVFMPEKGAQTRSRVSATLKACAHEMFMDPEIETLLSACEKEALNGKLSEDEQTNVRILRRDLNRRKKYSAEFIETLSKTCDEAYFAWMEARKKKDFSIYAPHLQKIVDLKKQEVKLLSAGSESSSKIPAYEHLLEDYEHGLSLIELDKVFAQVKAELFPFFKEVFKRPRPDSSFLHRKFSIPKQEDFTRRIVQDMGYSFQSGRADYAPHPFCTTFGHNDVRITIRGYEDFLSALIFAGIHEAGHALYELGLPMSDVNGHYGMPLGQALSMGFHESQSRIWENNVGRSLSFWQHYYPELQKVFPEQLGSLSLEAFYKGINDVHPSFIRVEADELTYHAHIYIRYQIERGLIEGSMQVNEIPKIWNGLMQEILGIIPSNDSEGCLQDPHWAYGSFGYFPTYSLGSFYAAQLMEQMEKENPELQSEIAKGNFSYVLNWLRKNVHSSGRKHTANELLKKVTGRPLELSSFMSYAKRKFG